MNLRQLETFYWAVKLGSFVAAAERLRATQSTVSMRIQELERELGAPLFDRGRKGLRASVKGRDLLPLAGQMIALEREIRATIVAPAKITGTLRMGVVEVVSTTWLPQLIKALHSDYPLVNVEMDEALTFDLVNRLRDGALDLVLTPGRPADGVFQSEYLGHLDFAWMASPELPIASRPISPSELVQWPIIALAQPSYHRRWLEEWFRSGDITVERFDTCKSLYVAGSLAAAGMGVTFLPVLCFASQLRSGTLRIVDVANPIGPVPFYASRLIDGMQPLAEIASLLASRVSDFPRRTAASANDPELLLG